PSPMPPSLAMNGRARRSMTRQSKPGRANMRVGVPKEIKSNENRVGLVPGSVRELIHHGHSVVVETKAGYNIGFDDQDYVNAGATIAKSAADVFANADMIVKVKEPQAAEIEKLTDKHTLFTY